MGTSLYVILLLKAVVKNNMLVTKRMPQSLAGKWRVLKFLPLPNMDVMQSFFFFLFTLPWLSNAHVAWVENLDQHYKRKSCERPRNRLTTVYPCVTIKATSKYCVYRIIERSSTCAVYRSGVSPFKFEPSVKWQLTDGRHCWNSYGANARAGHTQKCAPFRRIFHCRMTAKYKILRFPLQLFFNACRNCSNVSIDRLGKLLSHKRGSNLAQQTTYDSLYCMLAGMLFYDNGTKSSFLKSIWTLGDAPY